METVADDRELFAACRDVLRASGWWSEDQLAGYTQFIGRLMQSNDKDAKQAARDFWASRTDTSNSAAGINERIRADLAQVERKAA